MESPVASQPFEWQGSLLHSLSEAGFALSRMAHPSHGGHMWQDWAYRVLLSSRAHRTQGPGSLHLFHYPSASGLKHEIDAAGILDVAVVLEAKDQVQGIFKEQVDTFHGRTLDYFEGAVQRSFEWDLYRVMFGTGDIDYRVRRYAARLGIILVGRDRVPLPSLLAAAGKWDAAEWLSDQYLGDLVMLGERACRPLRVTYNGKSQVYQYPLDLWTPDDLDDLDDLHSLASEQWLEWLDKVDPLHYESHAQTCLAQVS